MAAVEKMITIARRRRSNCQSYLTLWILRTYAIAIAIVCIRRSPIVLYHQALTGAEVFALQSLVCRECPAGER